mgnify:FL=1
MNTNLFLRLKRSIIKKITHSIGYPKNHIINHLLDGIRIDPIYKERPLRYKAYFKEKIICTESLYSFREKYQSLENLFIIGSGPSIKEQPIELLKNKDIILLNGAIHLIKSHQLRPLGVVIIDDSFVRKNAGILSYIPSSTHLFLSIYALKEIFRKAPDLLHNPIYLVHELKCAGDIIPSDIHQCLYQFDKPTWGVFDGGTVMAVAIQLAAFISANNVWLLGLDIGNSNTEPRFYENQTNICRSSLITDYETKILPFMRLAAVWYRQNNKNIYNCSPISKLPFDIIPYNDINKILNILNK